MLITTLDWIGTIFILFGNYTMTSKKAFRPVIRLLGLSLFLISNIVWIPFAILLKTYGLLITQIILMIMNIRGIIICYLSLKNKEMIKHGKNNRPKL